MLAGFCSTLLLSWLPDAPGDAAERILPFVIAFAIAAGASSRGRRGAVNTSQTPS
jgi:hypothetical protein